MRSLLSKKECLILLALAALKFGFNLFLDQNYGYFRDEFYYMKLGERVFQGSTAMPLFAPLLMAFTLRYLGDSLFALHLLPTVAGALVILLTVFMAREFGGKTFAQALAGFCALLAPGNLGINSTFSYDSFDQLFWVICFYTLVRLLKNDEPRLWVCFGLAAGLGLFTKETMLFLGFAVAIAFLLTPQRKYYKTKWMWLGAGVAFVFAVPYLLMQADLNWPSLGYWNSYSSGKVYPASPFEFLLFQILVMNPLSLPIWLYGLWHTLFAPEAKLYRPLGLTYLVLFVLFVVVRAKFYFLGPVYPVLFAAGAVRVETLATRRCVKVGAHVHLAMLILAGIMLAPYAMPLLPLDTFIKIARITSGDLGLKQERHKTNILPQHFADRFGWENMARRVTKVFQSLSTDDQTKACIFTGNYGEAGAIEFFGKKLIPNMPPVLSGHGQYFFWGCGECTGEVMILIGIPRDDVAGAFENIIEAGRIQCEYSMPYENDLPIYVGRHSKKPLNEVWMNLGHFD